MYLFLRREFARAVLALARMMKSQSEEQGYSIVHGLLLDSNENERLLSHFRVSAKATASVECIFGAAVA
jgi:hypothetical protein